MAIRQPAKVGKLLAGEQPSGDDLDVLKAQGVRSVVNLREDGERDRPSIPAEEGRQAEALGLSFVHLPVTVPELSPELVEQFRRTVDALPGPVYVHCGLGQRAVTLALIVDAQDTGASAEDAIRDAERQGFEITPEVKTFIRTQLDRD
ncbi:hypothetical protein AZL_a04790 (plasmid) [Azospirillum sp. B510]|uniref:beta-lactamase hydrolase domain-containing protein n=1 Tax=Azospirillum sp. (strain B510) TaxID=137722 RepID=UPI0001C4BC2A|nr:sulfur transferase domain-containing protein [Azospirillum sp. B510]BAI74010.1 hypothetical protein AZL_a04790 [Azospirillum sp. B510]